MEFSFETILLAFTVTLGAGLATTIGGFIVLTSKAPSPRLLSFGLAFAAGAMVFISLTEILNKSSDAFALDYGEDTGFIYAMLWFLAGLGLIALIDRIFPNPHERLAVDSDIVDGHSRAYLKHVGFMTVLAITAHNFPEGLATFFSMLGDPNVGMSLAVAIAIHNIPEGVSIAIPVYFATNNKWMAIGACLLSGLAEPMGAAIGYGILQQYLSNAVFGGVFAMIAGVMVYLSLDELLPAAKRYAKGHETVYGLLIGMVFMVLSLVFFRL